MFFEAKLAVFFTSEDIDFAAFKDGFLDKKITLLGIKIRLENEENSSSKTENIMPVKIPKMIE
jgi:hypothetical protein